MPVIIHSQEQHPFIATTSSLHAIEKHRAQQQDIRPLKIAILNLMADKQTTERQLARWLGHTPLQIELTFIATDSYFSKIEHGYVSKNTPSDHIRKFYTPFSQIRDQYFDGLLITGVNALKDRVEDELIWPEVCAILDWSAEHVFSSLYLCWGAKAALKHFHNVDSVKGERKTFGLFEHRLGTDKCDLLFGFPDRFYVPVSRWKNPRIDQIEKIPTLEVLADSQEAGPNIIAECVPSQFDPTFYAKRLYILNHPEYDTPTLHREYVRDVAIDPSTPMPKHYYEDDAPDEDQIINSWRHTAFLYSNWIKSIYAAVPFDYITKTDNVTER